MADITETLARIVNTQADEIARLRKVNAGLIADSREQAATIRTLIDQRGAVAEIAAEPIGLRFSNWYNDTHMRMAEISGAVEVTGAIITAIIYGKVEPLGELRQRIEALIGGEVANG